MTREAVASDALVEVGQRRKIQGLKQPVVFTQEVAGPDHGL